MFVYSDAPMCWRQLKQRLRIRKSIHDPARSQARAWSSILHILEFFFFFLVFWILCIYGTCSVMILSTTHRFLRQDNGNGRQEAKRRRRSKSAPVQ